MMKLFYRKWIRWIGVLGGIAWLGAVSPATSAPAPTAPPTETAPKASVTVFAAASLKNALDAINAEWLKETGKATSVSYAASSALAKQIEQGAPADLFISADLAWMDYVAEKNLIQKDSRSNLLGNRLVLVSAKETAVPVTIEKGFNLAELLGDERLAMGLVDSVPAGKYGKAALESLGIWESVKDKIAGAESVRAALMFVSRGEAAYGIVYETDAAADPAVRIIGTFPENSHPPIIYPVALTSGNNKDAVAYLKFLKSAKAAPLFEAQGFTVLK